MTMSSGFVKSLWCLGALFGAAAWLQPNHYFPWPSFHADAWMAATLLVVALILATMAGREPLRLHVVAGWVIVAATVPWMQHLSGVVYYTGTALMATIYLCGLALAVVVGALAERLWPGRLVDFIMLMIGMACIVSVYIQFNQWLEIERIEIWSMGGVGNRPYANIGQPNLLGTLLLWGVIAAAWGVLRRALSWPSFTLMALFLLFGVALTESRTAMLNVVLLWLGTVYWRRLLPAKAVWLSTGLVLSFFLFLALFPVLHGYLFSSPVEGLGIRRMAADASSGLRLQVYAMYGSALLERPWFGFGWDQGVAAHIAMAPSNAALGTVFSYSHNLFLDLMLWNGIAIGSVWLIVIVWWLLRSALRVRSAVEVMLWMMIGVVFVHAMLELPLYFGYLLWPAGIVVGALNERQGFAAARFASARWTLLPIAALLVAVAIVGTDYVKAENNYREMRYESLGMAKSVTPPPRLMVLDQLHDVLWMGRYEPRPAMSADDLDRMRKTVVTFPSLGNMYRLAKALALNDQQAESAIWLMRMTKMLPRVSVELAKRDWMREGSLKPELAAVSWPD